MAKEVATARRLWAETGYGGVEDGVLDGAATKGPGLNSEHEAPAGCVISLIDNRAGEVGFCAFDPAQMCIFLTQYAETAHGVAATTRMLLEMYAASEAVLLAPDPSRSTQGSRFGSATSVLQALPLPDLIHTLPRSAFDDGKGRDALERVATAESWARITHATVAGVGHAGMYLALGAAGAMLQHLQQNGERLLLAQSVRVEVVGTSAHMRIDAGSITSLEVLPQSMAGTSKGRPAPSNFNFFRQRGKGSDDLPPSNFRAHRASQSLFHMFNHTRTPAGQRLLRATMLQPLTDVPSLEMRQEVVGELTRSDDLADDVARALSRLPPDLDKICSGLAMRPPGASGTGEQQKQGRWGWKQQDPTKRISATVKAVLGLRSLLHSLPDLAAATSQSDAALLAAMSATCSSAHLNAMLQDIDTVVDPEAQPSSTPFINRIQQCFAVRGGADQLLDVARLSFCRITDQVHNLAEQYRQQLEPFIPERKKSGWGRGRGDQGRGGGGAKMRVMYSNRNGFYLLIPQPSGDDPNQAAPPSLPRWVLVLEKRHRTSVSATTHELNALNARLRDAAHDCLVLTQQVLDALVARIVVHLPLLLRVVDSIALLDMLAAFAAAACNAGPDQPFTRPQFMTQGRLLQIVQGRHPLLELAEQPPQPNDALLDASTTCLHIITGPNMAGKSTYLKQVGLLVVLAQCGAYVPAEAMALRPLDAIFTRMGTGDSIETNASTFMVEMQEVAHILDQAGPSSLVLVDELGRATSTADGTALAWATCEALLAAHVPTLFATHFPMLARLSELYPAARLWRLRVDVSGPEQRMHYMWKLQSLSEAGDGVPHYGLALARSMHFPSALLDRAASVAAQVEAGERARMLPSDDEAQQAQQWAAVYDAAGQLMVLARQVAAIAKQAGAVVPDQAGCDGCAAAAGMATDGSCGRDGDVGPGGSREQEAVPMGVDVGDEGTGGAAGDGTAREPADGEDVLAWLGVVAQGRVGAAAAGGAAGTAEQPRPAVAAAGCDGLLQVATPAAAQQKATQRDASMQMETPAPVVRSGAGEEAAEPPEWLTDEVQAELMQACEHIQAQLAAVGVVPDVLAQLLATMMNV